MKKLSFILLIATFMTTGINAQNKTADEAGINRSIAEFVHSWNINDFNDMKSYLTADCNWVNVVGMHWKGLKEVQFAHQAFANTMFKGVKISTVKTEIHFLNEDVAIVYWTSYIGTYFINGGHTKVGDGNTLATFVFVKQNGKWMGRTMENVDVIKEAAPHDPVLKMNNR